MAANDEHGPLEVLASVELQERYVANATTEEYCLPEDLLNYAGDFVDHVERYQKAIATHHELATMSVEEMSRRSRDEIPPFVRKPGRSVIRNWESIPCWLLARFPLLRFLRSTNCATPSIDTQTPSKKLRRGQR